MTTQTDLKKDISDVVRFALAEDIGDGDITAALIPAEQQAKAQIISRERAIICGRDWVNEVLRQVDPSIKTHWHVTDGNLVEADQPLVDLEGPARSLLTAERCALNFLQTLSGTATRSHNYANLVRSTPVTLLDTRKTLPGLRTALKYAVNCGGCSNHRIGLYDAFLIKENHINACGSITAAVSQAKRQAPGKPVEVEVENFEELNEALEAGADIVMLDNFNLTELRQAVGLTAGRAKLEASGGITDDNLISYAETGVDYISIGALTKDCRAIDLSMRFF